ncbi:hypothetical protein HMI54_008327 [Coelomomyces lativittatus]|nr:hypothetical protein HMI56_007266 [Coelomomyces lativittatus]KAJ1513816.1 hypothetical protein HMI55_005206 [Coelomomyces lativittatus]KAJ1516761.1 hypothetical protein HMI54_008327 [Coelomomyces lativittatus]
MEVFERTSAKSTSRIFNITEDTFLKLVKASIIPDSTVYIDNTSACLWNHSLIHGGLLRFLNEGHAYSVRPLMSNISSPSLLSDSSKKVFIISVHLSTLIDEISSVLRSSSTSVVYILSSTPFRLLPTPSLSSTIFRIDDPIIELQQIFPGIDIHKQYLPMSWAVFLPNCLLVPPFVSVIQEEEKIKTLAISLFGLLQANDYIPNIWTLGPIAKQVAHSLKNIWHSLGADEYGHSEMALVIVDRLLDLGPILQFKSKSSSLISSIFSQGLLPEVKLSTLGGPDLTVPFSPNGHPDLLDWLQLLVDFPIDGVSILRKKSMDLGTKIRILGKPSAAQFTKILTALRENSSVLKDHMEALLFLSLVIEALEESPINSTWTSQVAAMQNLSEENPEDLPVQLLQWLDTAPTVHDALKLGIWAYFKTESDVIIHKISKWLPVELDIENVGYVFDLISKTFHACFDDPDTLEFFQFKTQKTGGFMRFLSTRQSSPSDFKNMVLCVTGAVSVEEMSLFRKMNKKYIADTQREIYLVATSVESGISFF